MQGSPRTRPRGVVPLDGAGATLPVHRAQRVVCAWRFSLVADAYLCAFPFPFNDPTSTDSPGMQGMQGCHVGYDSASTDSQAASKEFGQLDGVRPDMLTRPCSPSEPLTFLLLGRSPSRSF